MENNYENAPASQLPQPTKIRSPGKLAEITASKFNSRASAIPPPQQGLKRKTLAQQAAEPHRPAPVPPTLRPHSAGIRATSLSKAIRDPSFSSSVTSRSTSTSSSRNGSFSSSVGSLSRQAPYQHRRPQSAQGGTRIQGPNFTQHRPATALEMHPEEQSDEDVGGTRICETPVSFTPPKTGHGTQKTKSPSIRKRGHRHPEPWSEEMRAPHRPVDHREISISTRLGDLTLNEKPPQSSEKSVVDTTSPSRIPKRSAPSPAPSTVTRLSDLSPTKIPHLPPLSTSHFLTKSTNVKSAWNMETRMKELENLCTGFKASFDYASGQQKTLEETVAVYETKVSQLESERSDLAAKTSTLQVELDIMKTRLASSSQELEDSRRRYNNELDDLHRQHVRRMDDSKHSAESKMRQLMRDQEEKVEHDRRKLEESLQAEKDSHQKQLEALKREESSHQEQADKELERQKGAFQTLELDLDRTKSEVAREKELNGELRTKMSEISATNLSLETSVQRLESHIKFLESDNKSQSQAFADLEARTQRAIQSAAEANEKLIKEESLRRKLHNQVQELKGNIRVFCRARPSLENDATDGQAKILYPDDETDCREIEIMGPEEKSSLGNVTTRKNSFAFDRVFGPTAQNQDVFGEISQLVQSALDGYNVCIFCYGQTGSGKTFTMSASDGMIPRAVHQIYDTAKSLEEKGWKYHMEGSFIEVYNENLNDLLGKAEEFDKKKHEIKHDLQKGKTTITGVSTVELDSPGKVNSILTRATSNRSVAATQANERSSRSHSVFILKLMGENSITGEKSEGTLNLVDLAGSERLSHSGATGERLKETQNINKSLSCLGDVIAALGQGKEGAHVPYRNSKLTYLLQNSLGGNSKTLMFVMISPLQAHLSETLTSLKFATKVHNTHIGTAKKQLKA